MVATTTRESLIEACYKAQVIIKRINPASTAYRKKYYWSPYEWTLDYCDIKLPKYEIEILKMISDKNRKIAVYGPHGLGKSVLAAIIVLWAGSVSHDCKIPTTASAWRQLEEFLWPEIHKWYSHVSWDAIVAQGGEKPTLLNLQCQFSSQSKAFAVASDNPATIEGAHARRMVYVFDESKTIISGTWESAEGAFSTPGDHLQIALSTPGDTSGVFYSICSRAAGYEAWKVRRVTLREAIRAGRISLAWAREKRAAWGRDSNAYQNRVCGVFAKDSPDCIIPLSWIEAAIGRWYAWNSNGRKCNLPYVIGADTAGQGTDNTVFFYRYDKIGIQIIKFEKSRPMELAGKLKIAMGNNGLVNIDTSYGEGAGTADRLEEFADCKERINKVNFAKHTNKTDRTGLYNFANVRALLWWNMREILDPDNHEYVALPDDADLIGDLTAVRRLPIRSDGKIQIESKEDIKKRIGRSTDCGDACCLSFYLSKAEREHLPAGDGNFNGDYY